MYIYIDTDLIYIYYTVYVSANMYIYIYTWFPKFSVFHPHVCFEKWLQPAGGPDPFCLEVLQGSTTGCWAELGNQFMDELEKGCPW